MPCDCETSFNLSKDQSIHCTAIISADYLMPPGDQNEKLIKRQYFSSNYIVEINAETYGNPMKS